MGHISLSLGWMKIRVEIIPSEAWIVKVRCQPRQSAQW